MLIIIIIILLSIIRFVIANDEFKIKEFNADSKQCRKTTLAPTFGGPPNKLLTLKFNGAINHYAYSTAERIVGLGCLPLTGDPTQVSLKFVNSIIVIIIFNILNIILFVLLFFFLLSQ